MFRLGLGFSDLHFLQGNVFLVRTALELYITYNEYGIFSVFLAEKKEELIFVL